MKPISIVTTVYQSAPYLKEFYKRLKSSIDKIKIDYEIIFVNDASPDDSLEVLKELMKIDSHIKVINFSRNFGHHTAMFAGLEHSSGEYTFLIDCDLEEPPEILETFYEQIKLKRAEVIYGIQKKRSGSLYNKFIGLIYYKILKIFNDFDRPPNILTVRLMTRKYLEALLLSKEKAISIGGKWYITGFKQIPYPIDKKRKKTTTYDLKRKFSAFIFSVISFSQKPLFFIFYFGLVNLILSSGLLMYLSMTKLLFNLPVKDVSFYITAAWIAMSVQTFFIGTVALYISKITSEVSGRPRYIISEILLDHQSKNSSIEENLFANKL